MHLSIIWWLVASVYFSLAQAKRSLVATSLVTCMENSQASASTFDVTFNPSDRSLHYFLDMTTQISGYVSVDADVYAYGFKIISKSIDVCSLDWKQFCPMSPGNIEIESIEYISEEYVNEIPGIAYTVPDIDAYARLNIYNNESAKVACLQVFFSNGKTVSQIGIKWAAAVIAGIGLLLSAVLSTFGNSTAASHISANTMSLFLYFQSVAIVALQHVHRVPPIAEAWSENFAWALGLIRTTFMQKIFRWYVQNTGGTPSLYLTSTTMSVLTQRSLDYLKQSSIFKRSTNVLYGNSNTLIFRGIKRMAYNLNIENTSVVCTGFTFFIICGYVLAGLFIVTKSVIDLCIRAGWMNQSKFSDFRKNWKTMLKGALLRYIYIGFAQITIFGFWEFTERDSAAVIVITCLLLVLVIGLMLWAAYRSHFFAQKSIETYNNPAALLYGDERILHKYGFFYTMFNANHYWWNVLLLSYVAVKSLFIGFAQASGMTQALAIFILDLFYLIAVIRYKPYLDTPTNILNICISLVTTINSFLFLFFSDLFGQPNTVPAIMGWVYFILNAAFSFILLMMILAFAALVMLSKNPDLRFKPAKDDRRSFQRRSIKAGEDSSNPVDDELMALGNVARDHEDNWEDELEKRNRDNVFSDDYDEKFASYNASGSDVARKPTFTEKLLRKLSLKKGPKNSSTDLLGQTDDVVGRNNSQGTLSSSSNVPSRQYPGTSHNKHQSVSGNGLIDSFEDEQTDNPFSFDDEPRLVDDDFEDVSARNHEQNMQRDISLDTMNVGNNHATTKTDILDSNYF
ncbi:hypothetical protein KAFR_0F01280 [Kazachstania africana CBS 2517]|uniref:ML-like domain-containing protein n=1 Tax=Kazachstania africana (strain ATCC 22294 / BCRC 22015 / CBS 2517 / CECT 1963 / NBRC 1671 / NRRL Y-8276) TaxID=1071382 RepID=H2AWH4_KAZAF|nr:hypothetical protein KAFR_0F01280 [Kazachstania africana CBS 2517]CCF58724.1 hypothetical protein KAFR_0F01280 [Kazachstania africana CBS 2517]